MKMQNASVYATIGRLIYEAKINTSKHRVITSDFKKGAYVVVLRFKENERTETKTIIIN